MAGAEDKSSESSTGGKRKKKEETEEEGGWKKDEDCGHKRLHCSPWNDGFGSEADGATAGEEKGKEGGEKEGPQRRKQLQHEPAEQFRDRRDLGRVGPSVWRRSQGEDGWQEVPESSYLEHPGADASRCRDPKRPAVGFGPDFTSPQYSHSTYWRMMLSTRMTGAINREAQTLCYVQDQLIQGKVASACDTITQRLKGLEQVTIGSHYLVAQRQELVPVENTAMTSPMESLGASRCTEAKAKSAAACPWQRGQDWERRQEEPKGKGKGKDFRGKGKAKGDKAGQAKDEKEKERR